MYPYGRKMGTCPKIIFGSGRFLQALILNSSTGDSIQACLCRKRVEDPTRRPWSDLEADISDVEDLLEHCSCSLPACLACVSPP